MRNEVNLVVLSNKIPLSFSIIECDHLLPHMHSKTQIIVVIKGEIELTIEGVSYKMKKDDIISINPQQVHNLESLNRSIILSVFLDIPGFLDEDEPSENIFLQLNSIENPNDTRYEKIRYLIYSIIRVNSQENVNSRQNTKAIAYSLFAQLLNDFKVEVSNNMVSSKQYDTINLITTYINDNFRKKLTFTDIANHFNYTISYLSKLFKNKLNTTFINYYDNVRVNSSLDQLLLSNSSIEEIAIQNGFENSRSYVRAFQNVFKCYPSTYRKQHQNSNVPYSTNQSELQKEALDIILKNYTDYIQKYLINETIRDTKEIIELDMKSESQRIQNPIKVIFPFGNIKNLFLEMLQREMESIQKEIGYSYILLTDLISDEFSLFLKTNEKIEINLAIINYLNLILNKLKLTPFFVFEYDSYETNHSDIKDYIWALAEYLEKNPFQRPCMISIEYTPNILSNKEKTLQLFNENYDLFTKIKEHFNIITVSPIIRSAYDLNLFTTFHPKSIYDFYLIDYLSILNTPTIIKDKNHFNKFIDTISLNPKKIIIQNLNFTGEEKNLLNDTIYKSSFICKNIINTIDKMYAILINPMFDLSIHKTYQLNPFDGTNGFYTYNFLRKASYYANLFCAKLENNIIKKGKSFIVTANQNRMVILFNNYSHYSDLYAENTYFNIENENRYSCFAKSTKIHYALQIENLDYTSVKIKTSFITKKSGSSYDKYIETCKDVLLNIDEFRTFKDMCNINFRIEQKQIFHNRLLLEASLDPLDSQLVELTFYK